MRGGLSGSGGGGGGGTSPVGLMGGGGGGLQSPVGGRNLIFGTSASCHQMLG